MDLVVARAAQQDLGLLQTSPNLRESAFEFLGLLGALGAQLRAHGIEDDVGHPTLKGAHLVGERIEGLR